MNDEPPETVRGSRPEGEGIVFASSSSGAPGAPVGPPPAIPDHELLRRVGKGSYGAVWLARNVMGSYRAVKVVYRQAFEQDRPYQREFEGIQKFEPVSRRHECLVDVLHVGRNEAAGYFYDVMELADPVGVPASAGRVPESEEGLATADDQPAEADTPYRPRTLRADLSRHGRLPVADGITVGLRLTQALDHPHQTEAGGPPAA